MTKPVSALRQRMIDDMKIRNMALSTQYIYVRAVQNYSAFHGGSRHKLTIEDVRDYRLHLIARGLKTASINPIMGGLRFFYGVTPASPTGSRLSTPQHLFDQTINRLTA